MSSLLDQILRGAWSGARAYISVPSGVEVLALAACSEPGWTIVKVMVPTPCTARGGSGLWLLSPTLAAKMVPFAATATEVISHNIRQALTEHGIAQCQLQTRLSPPWTTDWMSDAAKTALVSSTSPAGLTPLLHAAGRP